MAGNSLAGAAAVGSFCGRLAVHGPVRAGFAQSANLDNLAAAALAGCAPGLAASARYRPPVRLAVAANGETVGHGR